MQIISRPALQIWDRSRLNFDFDVKGKLSAHARISCVNSIEEKHRLPDTLKDCKPSPVNCNRIRNVINVFQIVQRFYLQYIKNEKNISCFYDLSLRTGYPVPLSFIFPSLQLLFQFLLNTCIIHHTRKVNK